MTRGIIIFFVGIAVVYFGLNAAANWVEMTPSPADRKFQVVDTYKGCDVVEYRPDYSSRYSYFLHCK